jgi:hypothetical protein
MAQVACNGEFVLNLWSVMAQVASNGEFVVNL